MNLQWRWIAPGALLVALVCVPLALFTVAVDLQRGSPLAALLFFVFLVVFAAGGAVSAHRAEERALPHATAAALLGWLVVQTVGTLGRLVRGDTISWGSLVIIAVLVATAGMLGGVVALYRESRR